jgi:Cu-processing system permease protein
MILILAGREWRAALAARWFWFYGGATAALGAGLLWMASGMIPAGVPESLAGGRVLMATVNLLALLVPLMGLTAGAQCLAGERDRRTLGYLLAQPVTRSEILLGKLLGNGLALGAGLGGATLVLALAALALAVPLPVTALLAVAGLGWLLALATMALGAALGAGAPGLVAAQGALLVTWLLLVLLGDLSLMGLLMAKQHVPPQALLALTFINPVHQFRVAAVALFRPSMEVLGPVGLYARERLGGALVPVLAASLLVWTTGAVLVALERFQNSRSAS